MKKFNDKTILDYISGNDIEGFEIEELEDSVDFMKKVINYTNDQKMIAMCSNRVQEDPEFVKFVLYKFSYDLDFICSIADAFLRKRKKCELDYEIAIIMTELTGNCPQDPYNKYAVIASVAFLWEMETVAQCKANCQDERLNSGEGFIFIQNDDTISPVMIYYYAKKLIDHIFIYHNINLENVLHKRFESSKELEEEKINTFLISFISVYDSDLADYIKVHIELLDPLKEEIRLIVEKWDNYALKEERRIYQLLFEVLQEYSYRHPECPFSEDELLYSVGKDLGIFDKIKKYDITLIEDDIDFIKPVQEMNFVEKRHYFAVKKLMTDIINGNYKEEEYGGQEDNKKKRKIIDIDFSTQKKG